MRQVHQRTDTPDPSDTPIAQMLLDTRPPCLDVHTLSYISLYRIPLMFVHTYLSSIIHLFPLFPSHLFLSIRSIYIYIHIHVEYLQRCRSANIIQKCICGKDDHGRDILILRVFECTHNQ